jgi:hypothetical protein
MAVEIVSRDRASCLAVQALGLDASVLDLTAPEAMAELLRRVASFTCPASEPQLIEIAYMTMRELVDDPGLRERLSDLLHELIGVGDLLELEGARGDRQSSVYLGQPSFVRRSGGRYMLIGVRPEGAPLLEGELSVYVRPEGHIRLLELPDEVCPVAGLTEQGLRPLSLDNWLRSHRSMSPGEHVSRFDARLDAEAAGYLELADALIIDPKSSVTYYRGRWRAPKAGDTGRFVGRRPRSYGSHVWMYVELSDGVATRAIDLPIEPDASSRGADEAWRLQAALDRLSGTPQLVRLKESAPEGRSLLLLYSPLPRWIQRRLDLVGVPTFPQRGALMGYSLPSGESGRELQALEEYMWVMEACDA